MESETYFRKLAAPLLGKWSVFIILVLFKKEMYFAELERNLDGISRKVLTQSLNELISINIISKRGIPSTGHKTFYSLTELGESLIPLILQIKEWIRTNEHILSNNTKSISK